MSVVYEVIWRSPAMATASDSAGTRQDQNLASEMSQVANL